MEQKIRVGAVSYLNTKPLVYGFEKGLMQQDIELQFDYPANVAAKLLNNEIDIGLIPVAVLPKLQEHYVVSDFCIGASGPVASVCLFSDVPLNEIKQILVDYQSRTSAALLKILLKEYWKINPELVDTGNGYQQNIKGTTAGLIIGDRALLQRQHSNYIFDLAEAWQQMTGLPFVFAAWIANKKLPQNFIQSFNETTGIGLKHIEEIVSTIEFNEYDMHQYYTQNIDYRLDEKKLEAVKLFLSKLI
ncbi:MAG TPA: menaquinone biosynthesis protein [Ferruginibacter sp.]|nr:menaquinone biosynthesis protein [Ferruginibacter sp.]HRE63372.1 menaquinone biosynthesis protein [Ferruginibacter sp.]